MSKPLALQNTENEFPAADDLVAEVGAGQPPCRPRNAAAVSRAARFLAVVAADTEQEARSLAAGHDPLRGDWRNPQFALSECEDTGEPHVFGDVVISAPVAPPVRRSNKG